MQFDALRWLAPSVQYVTLYLFKHTYRIFCTFTRLSLRGWTPNGLVLYMATGEDFLLYSSCTIFQFFQWEKTGKGEWLSKERRAEKGGKEEMGN